MNVKVIGLVREGREQAHVVARLRQSIFGRVESKTVVVSLKRNGGEWKLVQTPETAGLFCTSKLRLGFGQ